MKTGTFKPNAIVVGEFTVSFLEPTVKFSAKAAFVDSVTGHTHGWTTQTQWSDATHTKLRELREAMETDLGKTHFSDGSDDTTRRAPLGPSHEVPPTAGGIGEHLGDEGQDAPSI